MLTVTGLSPSPAPPSKGLHLHTHFLTARPAGRPDTNAPTTPRMQPLPGITHPRFSLIRFRSPLLSESQLFSLPMGTEMFHFPTFPPHALYIQAQVTRHDSCWVSPFGHPRITARLPTPQGLSQAPTSFIGSRCQGIHHVPFTACRHQHHTTPHRPHDQQTTRSTDHTINRPHGPPRARHGTGHDGTPQKKLTRQPPPEPTAEPTGINRRTNNGHGTGPSCTDLHRSTFIHSTGPTPPTQQPPGRQTPSGGDARVHYSHLKQQPHTTHPPGKLTLNNPTAGMAGTLKTTAQPPPPGQPPLNDQREGADLGGGARAVRSQNPNSVPPPEPRPERGVDRTSTSEHPNECPPVPTDERRPRPVGVGVLLRKEVIQPHLPVRLPCYDFVPIASPTFDHSLPQAGWAMGFGCCRLS